MISIALCDDEKVFLSYYEKKLNEIALKENILINIVKFESGVSLLFNLEDNPKRFDFVFLDVLMPQINGIELNA